MPGRTASHRRALPLSLLLAVVTIRAAATRHWRSTQRTTSTAGARPRLTPTRRWKRRCTTSHKGLAMSDSTTNLEQMVDGQPLNRETFNQLTAAMSPASYWGRHEETSSAIDD